MKIVRTIIVVDAILLGWIITLMILSKDVDKDGVQATVTKSLASSSHYHTVVDIPAPEEVPTPKYEPIVKQYTNRKDSVPNEKVIDTSKEFPTMYEKEHVTRDVPDHDKNPVIDKGQADVTMEEKNEAFDLEYWQDNVCDGIKDSICHEVFVVVDKKTTFCSAAKVASTTTKTYFYKLSSDLVIPEDAMFGVHEANWSKFHMLDKQARKHVLTSPDWTHVFFWKHVLERFVSGYLDKVVNDCKMNDTIEEHLAIYHYVQYGFSCEQHVDLEAFISFMETVPSFEGHFHAQAPLCSLDKYPFTDIISADKTLSDSLKALSVKLGVEHPMEDKRSSTHSTKASAKMVTIFKDKPHLIQRILDLFKVDCEMIPDSCNIEKLMAEIAVAKQS